jgi:hypothetical protein
MQLLSRFQKQPIVSDAEVKEIQERVQTMRKQVGRRDVELADLFALLGEDERPALREMNEVKRPEITRVWPNQVPELQKTPEEASMPEVTYTYQTWEELRRKGLITLP